MNPLILIPVLLVLSLNLFAHVSREWCNSTLRVLRLYAKFAAGDFRHWRAPSPQPLTVDFRLNYQPLGLSAHSQLSAGNTTSPPANADCFSDLGSLLQNFPVDLRTLMDRFGMQAKIEVYAICPDLKCCAVYAPVVENGVKMYPRLCTKRHLRNRVEKECGAWLCTDGVSDGKSVRIPIKSFPVQDWDDFKV